MQVMEIKKSSYQHYKYFKIQPPIILIKRNLHNLKNLKYYQHDRKSLNKST